MMALCPWVRRLSVIMQLSWLICMSPASVALELPVMVKWLMLVNAALIVMTVCVLSPSMMVLLRSSPKRSIELLI